MKYLDMPEGCGGSEAYDKLMAQSRRGRSVVLIPVYDDVRRAMFIRSVEMNRTPESHEMAKHVVDLAVGAHDKAARKGLFPQWPQRRTPPQL